MAVTTGMRKLGETAQEKAVITHGLLRKERRDANASIPFHPENNGWIDGCAAVYEGTE